jgi:hypothetical protein
MVLFFIVQTSTHLISFANARSKRMAVLYYRVFPIFLLIALVGTLSPLVILYEPDHSKYFLVAALHYILLGILTFVLMIVFSISMQIIVKELNFAINSLANTHSAEKRSNSGGGDVETGGNPRESGLLRKQEQTGLRKEDLLRAKLAQSEAQMIQFFRESVFHLFAAPLSIAIGCSPTLLSNCSYYLPSIWFVAAIASVKYCAITYRAIKSMLPNAVNLNAVDKQHASDVAEEDSHQFTSGTATPQAMAGLGLALKKKKRKAKWLAKMSRITEISMENESRIASTNDLALSNTNEQ